MNNLQPQAPARKPTGAARGNWAWRDRPGIFWLIVPVGLLGLVAARRFMPGGDLLARRGFDGVGYALLAFGMTYAHEMFHARVEAALSWAEINAQQPRHLRYKERVYQALRETPDWLEEALANLDKDRDFLTKGGVFSNDWIDAYLALKMEEVNKVRMTTHPVEFDLYYSC